MMWRGRQTVPTLTHTLSLNVFPPPGAAFRSSVLLRAVSSSYLYHCHSFGRPGLLLEYFFPSLSQMFIQLSFSTMVGLRARGGSSRPKYGYP